MMRFRFSLLLSAATLLVSMFAGCSKNDSTGTNPPPSSSIDEKERPIVFMHGALEAADAWVPMTQLFALNGYQQSNLLAFDCENYYTGTQPDVSKMASQLQAMIIQVLAQTKVDRVDIVGHGIGAQAVQYYLTKLGGTEKAAHVVMLGGVLDPALVLSGTATPSPCKYMTIRSDGGDALQSGNPNAGTLQGADNRQLPSLDHQQLLASASAFAAIHEFFTGKTPSVTKIPASANLQQYSLRFRVISFIDNTPIPGATVRFIRVKRAGVERQVTKRSIMTVDGNGYISFVDTVVTSYNPNNAFDLEIAVSATGYQDMHIYRQLWRANSNFERLRMFPKSGGGPLVQPILQALSLSSANALVLIHSPYNAISNGRDNIDIETEIGEASYRKLSVVNPQTGPVAGGSAQASNVFQMFVFDYGTDRADGTGPMPVQSLNAFGITSFDMFLDASNVSLFYGAVTFNGQVLGFRNFKSLGTNPNNGGLDIVQFDYFN